MRRALSTAACAVPAAPRPLLKRWRELGGGRVDGLALDARLPPELQAELLHLCRGARVPCHELTHPGQGWQGRRAASPISDSRDERAVAVEQVASSLRLAAEAGVPRVLLPAGRLRLSASRGELLLRFTLGRPVLSDALGEERAALAAPALDGLCLVLDDLLLLCAQLSLSLVLPVPAAWPDQVPDLHEAARLLELFRGAPLGTCYGTDWAEAAARMTGTEPPLGRETPGLSSLRIADACGLRQRLPPWTGEVRFEELLAGTALVDQVLAAGPEVRPAELARAIDQLDALADAQPPDPGGNDE